jgi:hypothetical protein
VNPGDGPDRTGHVSRHAQRVAEGHGEASRVRCSDQLLGIGASPILEARGERILRAPGLLSDGEPPRAGSEVTVPLGASVSGRQLLRSPGEGLLLKGG